MKSVNIKSLESKVVVGSLIRTMDNEIFEVTFCGKLLFECVSISSIDVGLTRKYYYNIPMIVYEKVESNIPVDIGIV